MFSGLPSFELTGRGSASVGDDTGRPASDFAGLYQGIYEVRIQATHTRTRTLAHRVRKGGVGWGQEIC